MAEKILEAAKTFIDVVSCDNEAEREKKIKELISCMTLDEKIKQMSGDTGLARILIMLPRYNLYTFDSGKNTRLGIPPIKFTDGPRGVTLYKSTCFPVSMARGATWDPELEQRVGDAIGIEARALGANYFGGVCINLLRHPGGGRAQETYGEDPHHLGAMAVALVKGTQNHVMACVKHFALNSIEESRFYVDVRVDERTLREIYLPHFKKCVEAGVASVMSAYNKVNGKYCGHNAPLLRDILKRDWKFDGFVLSDFGLGVRSGKAGALGGLDIEMPIAWRYGKRLKKLVINNEVPKEVIDEAVERILRIKARFHHVGDHTLYTQKKVACKEHTELALEVARKSMVLLKNEGSALPLDRNDIREIAVIGKIADISNIGDKGSSRVRPPYVVTALEGIRKIAGDTINIVYESGKNLDAARKAARDADAAIVVVGLSGRDEGEFIPLLPGVVTLGGDREDLNLAKKNEELVKAVAEESDRCIVVLEGGSAITVEAWVDQVEALLMAWYPGMEGGTAIAEILFGDVNPSGKLPIIFPKSTEQLPFFDKKAKSIDYGYYHGYRLLDRDNQEPRFAFGFGMSYTKFEYKNLRLDKKEADKSGKIKVEVDVTNSGKVKGDEIVELYVGYNGSAVDRPKKDLKGFGKLSLEPGETKTLPLNLYVEELAYYDVDSASWKVEEIEYVIYVGPSSRSEDLKLSDTLKVSG